MQKTKPVNKRSIIEEVLKCMGLSPNKLGYIYLSAIISKIWEELKTDINPFLFFVNQVSKAVEAEIEEIYQEIKYTIEEAWFLGNYIVIDHIFGYSLEKNDMCVPLPERFVESILNIIFDIEKNDSDVLEFFRFLRDGGYVMKRSYGRNYINNAKSYPVIKAY